jgi:RNA polymerase sigma-70 factor (ECF subfamily)
MSEHDIYISDEDLVQRFVHGNIRAFDLLISRYSRRIRAYVHGYVLNQAVSEELTQEIFIKVIKGINEFRGDSKFSTWIFVIARNVALDFLRSAKNHVYDSDNKSKIEQTDNTSRHCDSSRSASKNVETVISHKEFMCELNLELKHLPDDQRDVFILKEFSELTFEEIAEITGVNINTVKSRLRYAMLALRKNLEKFRE